MTALPEHTSAAQLSTYSSCPRKYKLRYLDHAEPEFRSVTLALGSAVHSAIGWWFTERGTNCRPSLDELKMIVRADLTAATDERTRYGQWTHEALEKHAEALVQRFLDRHGELAVRATEVRFDLELHDPETGEVLPRKLLGYFDLMLDDGSAVELKTARSNYTAVDIARSLQFGGYRLALERLRIGDELRIIVMIKNKAPRLQEIWLGADRHATEFFLHAVASIERAILDGHFPPALGIGCAACEYQKRCLGVALDSRLAEAA